MKIHFACGSRPMPLLRRAAPSGTARSAIAASSDVRHCLGHFMNASRLPIDCCTDRSRSRCAPFAFFATISTPIATIRFPVGPVGIAIRRPTTPSLMPLAAKSVSSVTADLIQSLQSDIIARRGSVQHVLSPIPPLRCTTGDKTLFVMHQRTRDGDVGNRCRCR